MTYHNLTNSNLACVLDIIHETLEKDEIYHVIQPVESDPNCYFIISCENDSYHSGFVAWNDNDVQFSAIDDEVSEGEERKESERMGWNADNVEIFLMHLNGDVAEVFKEYGLIAQLMGAVSSKTIAVSA